MERSPGAAAIPLVAIVSVMAYRLLRDVRQAGSVSWRRAESQFPDAAALEAAVGWLCDRDLVRVDNRGLAAKPSAG